MLSVNILNVVMFSVFVPSVVVPLFYPNIWGLGWLSSFSCKYRWLDLKISPSVWRHIHGIELGPKLPEPRKICRIFVKDKCIWWTECECIFPLKWLHQIHFFAEFILSALLATGFSIRVLRFGYIEPDVPTPVYHPPSWGTCYTGETFTLFKVMKKLTMELCLKQ